MSGILFFDIDGTLVDSEHGELVPDEKTMCSLKQAQTNGYKCFICTGRNLGGLGSLKDLGFDGCVFSDGAGILIDDEMIIHSIPEELVREFTEQIMHEFDGEIMMSSAYGFFASDRQYDEMVEVCRKAALLSNESWEDLFGVYHLKKLKDYQHEEILECDVSFKDESIEKEWLKHKSDQLEYISTTASYGRNGATTGEVTSIGITKGRGCLEVMKTLGIDREHSYAFGDSMNDASMLKACGTGIAMGNACGELKEIADHVTTDIQNDGITNALKHFKII